MTLHPLPTPALGAAERVDTDFGPLWFRSDDDVMRPMARQTRRWEVGETSLLLSLVKPGHRILDVGAHIGYFSAVAHSGAPGVTIDAIEPDAFTAALCELNLFAVGAQATVWRCGLGDRRDTLGFTVAQHNPGDSRVVHDATANAIVPVVPGDELFPDARFDIVKIDVQGFERQVFLGMQGLLRRSRDVKVLVEFFPGAIIDGGSRPLDTLREYEAMGFTVRALVGDKLRELDFDEVVAVCSSSGPQGFVTLLLSRS